MLHYTILEVRSVMATGLSLGEGFGGSGKSDPAAAGVHKGGT